MVLGTGNKALQFDWKENNNLKRAIMQSQKLHISVCKASNSVNSQQHKSSN